MHRIIAIMAIGDPPAFSGESGRSAGRRARPGSTPVILRLHPRAAVDISQRHPGAEAMRRVPASSRGFHAFTRELSRAPAYSRFQS